VEQSEAKPQSSKSGVDAITTLKYLGLWKNSWCDMPWWDHALSDERCHLDQFYLRVKYGVETLFKCDENNPYHDLAREWALRNVSESMVEIKQMIKELEEKAEKKRTRNEMSFDRYEYHLDPDYANKLGEDDRLDEQANAILKEKQTAFLRARKGRLGSPRDCEEYRRCRYLLNLAEQDALERRRR
jgi:hypothetical protein